MRAQRAARSIECSPARLPGIDFRGLRTREVKDAVVDERIVQDRVRLLEGAQRVHGEVARIARPRADQPHGAELERRTAVQHAFQLFADHRDAIAR